MLVNVPVADAGNDGIVPGAVVPGAGAAFGIDGGRM